MPGAVLGGTEAEGTKPCGSAGQRLRSGRASPVHKPGAQICARFWAYVSVKGWCWTRWSPRRTAGEGAHALGLGPRAGVRPRPFHLPQPCRPARAPPPPFPSRAQILSRCARRPEGPGAGTGVCREERRAPPAPAPAGAALRARPTLAHSGVRLRAGGGGPSRAARSGPHAAGKPATPRRTPPVPAARPAGEPAPGCRLRSAGAGSFHSSRASRSEATRQVLLWALSSPPLPRPPPRGICRTPASPDAGAGSPGAGRQSLRPGLGGAPLPGEPDPPRGPLATPARRRTTPPTAGGRLPTASGDPLPACGALLPAGPRT